MVLAMHCFQRKCLKLWLYWSRSLSPSCGAKMVDLSPPGLSCLQSTLQNDHKTAIFGNIIPASDGALLPDIGVQRSYCSSEARRGRCLEAFLRVASSGVLVGGDTDTLIRFGCEVADDVTRAVISRVVNDTIEAGRSPRS